MIYQSEKRQKAIKKICANSMARKSIYFRRNLCINNKITNIKIIKGNQKQNLNNLVLDESLIKCCFLLEHTSKIKIDNPKSNLDVVGTNYNDLVLARTSLQVARINKIDWESIGVKNIWIFKEGWIKRLEIKINSVVSTKSKI